MTRHESRELAFALLFERQFTDQSYDEIIENAAESRDVACSAFCRRLVNGVESNAEAIDAAIEASANGWKLRRISRVALAVLRLAVYEVLFEKDIPDGVSANEAVEIAKLYGGREDASFVNGVISGVIRGKEAPAPAAAPEEEEHE